MSTFAESGAADIPDRLPLAGGPQLWGSAVIYVAANLLASAIPFLLLPVLTRVLSPADLGRVAMFSALHTMLLPLVGLSTKQAVAAHFFNPRAEVARFLAASLLLIILSSASLALLIMPVRNAIAASTQLPPGWISAAVLAAAAHAVVLLILALWQARRNAARFGTFQVLHAAMNAGLSLLFVLSLGWGWQGRALGQLGALVLFAALGLLLLRSASDLAWPPQWRHMREALAFGLPLVPHGLATGAVMVADRFLLTGMAGVEQTGLYTAALQVATVLALVVQPLNRAYLCSGRARP